MASKNRQTLDSLRIECADSLPSSILCRERVTMTTHAARSTPAGVTKSAMTVVYSLKATMSLHSRTITCSEGKVIGRSGDIRCPHRVYGHRHGDRCCPSHIWWRGPRLFGMWPLLASCRQQQLPCGFPPGPAMLSFSSGLVCFSVLWFLLSSSICSHLVWSSRLTLWSSCLIHQYCYPPGFWSIYHVK